MNKIEITFALKLIDKIEREVVGYNKIRSYCEGLKYIFEEERDKNMKKHKKRWKSMNKKIREERIKKMREGRKKWIRGLK